MRAFFAFQLACLNAADKPTDNHKWNQVNEDFTLVQQTDESFPEKHVAPPVNAGITDFENLDGFGFAPNKLVNDNHREIVNEEFLQGSFYLRRRV